MNDVRPYWSIEACGWVRSAELAVQLPLPRDDEGEQDAVLDLEAATDLLSGVPV
jgi:hypothetical protein